MSWHCLTALFREFWGNRYNMFTLMEFIITINCTNSCVFHIDVFNVLWIKTKPVKQMSKEANGYVKSKFPYAVVYSFNYISYNELNKEHYSYCTMELIVIYYCMTIRRYLHKKIYYCCTSISTAEEANISYSWYIQATMLIIALHFIKTNPVKVWFCRDLFNEIHI